MSSKSDYYKTHVVRHFLFLTIAFLMVIYAAFALFWMTCIPVLPYSTMIGIVIGLISLGLCFFVYLKKPADPGARVFYFLVVCMCSQNFVFMNFQCIQNPLGVLSDILIFFIAPLSLHFTLIFPEQKKIIIKYRVLLRVIYLPVLFFISAYAFLWFKEVYFHLNR